jgi:hypothetical protein
MQMAQRGSGRLAVRYTQPIGIVQAPTSGPPRVLASSSPTTFLRFTPAEIAQRRKENKCFHCEELFTPGHKQHCKQLFVMEVLQEDDDGREQELYSDEPTISIAALTGIQPRKGSTMQVYVTVQGAVLRALLDSGFTHNFVDSEAAARVGIKFSSKAGFSVAVANGDRVASSGSCSDLKINITGEPFIIACYGLSLGSYEMILGVQWLESLGPVLWDFTHRTLSFCRDGRDVHWSASVPPEPLGPAVAAVVDDVLGDLLLRFEPLFSEPSGLPPQRNCCHQIRLVPGTPPVAVRRIGMHIIKSKSWSSSV